MSKYKRLFSSFLILNLIFDFNVSSALDANDANENLSKLEKFKSNKKNINDKSYKKISHDDLFKQYELCEQALAEQKQMAFLFKLLALGTVVLSPLFFGSLFAYLEWSRMGKKEKFCRLEFLEHEDVTDETVNYQTSGSYSAFAVDQGSVVRTNIKSYTDAIKYFGNMPKFVNILKKVFYPWSDDVQQKVLEYLRLSGILGWSFDGGVFHNIDGTDAYLISSLARLVLNKDKDLLIEDLQCDFRELSHSLIYVTLIGDVSIYTFTFYKNDNDQENGIKGQYLICQNKEDNKIIILPARDVYYYYVLDMNSHIEGYPEYPSFSKFFIYDSDKKTVIKSVYVPSSEKVKKIFNESV